MRTADLIPGERFARWYEMASQAHVRAVVSSDHEDDFQATMRVLDLGAVQVSSLTYPSLRAHRTRRLISQSDPEFFCVALTLRGCVVVSHASTDAASRAGNVVLYDTSRPCLVVNAGPVAQTILQFPRQLLPLRPAAVDRLLATPVSARCGIGALVSRFLAKLIRHADEYGPADGARLSAVVLDLLAALYARPAGEERCVSADAHRRVLEARVLDFIQQRLGDHGLNPAMIAAAHGISTRYLHLLFQEREATVSGWIRQRRLDRCRRDLADPDLEARSVHAIGARWGFAGGAAFSRAFSRAYGLPPGEYRRLLRREPGCADGQ